MTSVALLDYGSGNLRSAQRALVRAGAEVVVTSDYATCLEAEGLVVPGVGAFAACMRGINAVRGGTLVWDRLRKRRPVLGICVGMQVLYELGVEHEQQTSGIGVLPGAVTRIEADVVPHMGWNTVEVAPGSVLFTGIEPERFYFVHSYAAGLEPPVHDGPGEEALLTTAVHGQRFVAAVERGALSATQFHPEKSGDAGAVLLANWVGTL